MNDPYETVHNVDDYYDGPREGVADFHGSAHVFQCVWDEAANNWSERFTLSPVAASKGEGKIVDATAEFVVDKDRMTGDLPPGQLQPLRVRWRPIS